MILVHKITKNKEGLYYTVPFSVPENVIKITVSYDYYKPTKGMLGDLKPSNTIDIGLMDEKGNFLGWSGSAHKNISVGEYESSAGYLTQRINSGEWQKRVFEYELLKSGDLLTRAKEKDIQIVSWNIFKNIQKAQALHLGTSLPFCNAFLFVIKLIA